MNSEEATFVPDEGLDELMDSVPLDMTEEEEPVEEESEEEAPTEAQNTLAYMEELMKQRKDQVEAQLSSIGIDQEKIDELKRRFGAVYTFAPTDTDVYIYRPLFKPEWDQIQNRFKNEQNPEPKVAEVVVKRCTVHPPMNNNALKKSRAGLLSVLYEVIMQSSYFYSPDQAMQMIVEL